MAKLNTIGKITEDEQLREDHSQYNNGEVLWLKQSKTSV